MGLFKMLLDDNPRNVKKLGKIAEKVEERAYVYAKMSDEELQKQTPVLKERLDKGETLNDILPDAFALVREASTRVLKQRHYFVQLMGGIALHQGRVAELRTGEGKTLMETLPAYLNALSGKGVHIVTVNEYLAKRDSEQMGKIFNFLGLSIGITLSGDDDNKKRKAYEADITYGTHAEFGFDYLRDNMKQKKEHKVNLRGYNFAIVDEVDSVLIDEARTPLIISGGKGFRNNDNYYNADRFVRTIKKDEDLDIDEEKNQIRLTDSGITKAERFFKLEEYADGNNMELIHYIDNALRAHFMMENDKDYIVNDGEVLIVDEFTGRVMAGRRFSDGLHQAIEAKEGVKINDENLTVATITYQNFFRLYKKLSGMTGTAKTEEREFNNIYKLDVVAIPTNKPVQRLDHPDKFFRTRAGKNKNVVNEIIERNLKGQPVLVGTLTVERSEELSKLLKMQKVKHVVLNAKNHERESEIVAQAGKLGAVTIATNMAGRGTDILLGGNPEFMAKQRMREENFEEFFVNEAGSFAPTEDAEILAARKRYNELFEMFKKECDEEKEKVLALGGLCIIGTERHESRRIDNQLRGRAGRQGDPGESTFYVSLEDDLLRIYGDRLNMIAAVTKNFADDEPIMQNRFISAFVENAQKRVEGANYGIRKNLLQFDDVLDKQRTIIYAERDKVLDGVDFHAEVVDMIAELSNKTVNTYISDAKNYYEWNLDELNKGIEEFLLEKGTNFITPENVDEAEVSDVVTLVTDKAIERLDNKTKEYNEKITNFMGMLERFILLKNVDSAWVEHIDNMTILKREIQTRTDPFNSYKQEGFEMFDDMIVRIRELTAKMVLNVKAKIEVVEKQPEQKQTIATQAAVESTVPQATYKVNPANQPVTKKTIVNEERQVGRNEQCPCGSGKKYKQCCGG